MTVYETWNCVGAVLVTKTDANGGVTTYGYENSSGIADAFWRVMSITDAAGNEVWKTYPLGWSQQSGASTFTFNSGNSTQSIVTGADAYGRMINKQLQQTPTSTQYDTTSTQYSWSGNYREVQSTLPCSASSGTQCSFSSGTTTTLLDPLGRPYTVTDGGGAIITKTYSSNDVLTVLSPAPSGENVKQFQREYDGSGRLSKVCAIGNGYTSACGQNTGTAKGVTTSYSYVFASGSTTTTATRGAQNRVTIVDSLGRVTQKSTPESGTWNYYYDSYSSCPTGYNGATGQLAATQDPNGNLLCYAYDGFSRVTGLNANGTTCRHFYYDSSTGYSGAIPSGVSTPTYPLGHMVEAATDSCSTNSLITDEWFSYDIDGHMTDMWEMTPHSGQYYHSKAAFAGNGVVTSLQLTSPSLYTMNYGLDGEGRWVTLSKGSSAIVTGPTTAGGMYDAAGHVLNVQLTGSTPDQDIYTYDPNTGRMKTFEFEVGNTPANITGTLTWNINGTLGELQITDGFNSGGTETCYSNSSSALGYGYDDWGRLVEFDCGSGNWGQQFSYDQYDNLTKTVISGRSGTTWNPGYNSNNQVTGASYDADGNMTNDGVANVYGWNEFAKVKWTASSGTPTCGTSGKCVTYDAFGRMVETSSSTTWTELWYTQVPGSRVSMSGTTENFAYWPSPGRGTYVDAPGYAWFLHQDWLGSDRIVSTLNNHTVVADRAYTPYGEQYNTFGSTNPIYGIFAEISGDYDPGVLFDTPNRELASAQGRWISPDPAGAGWNQYGYTINPNSMVDPSGLCTQAKLGRFQPYCPDIEFGGGYNTDLDYLAYFGTTTVTYNPFGSNQSTVGADSGPAMPYSGNYEPPGWNGGQQVDQYTPGSGEDSAQAQQGPAPLACCYLLFTGFAGTIGPFNYWHYVVVDSSKSIVTGVKVREVLQEIISFGLPTEVQGGDTDGFLPFGGEVYDQMGTLASVQDGMSLTLQTWQVQVNGSWETTGPTNLQVIIYQDGQLVEAAPIQLSNPSPFTNPAPYSPQGSHPPPGATGITP